VNVYVTSLQHDNWTNRRNDSSIVEHPSWADIEIAIRNLDGTHHTIVTLVKNPNAYLTIGGQWNERFIVNATPDNYDFVSMVDPDGSPEKVLLFIGGQDGEYEKRKCVPLQWVLKAAKTYAETGELDSSVNWESDY
jgi:hypothetical protein